MTIRRSHYLQMVMLVLISTLSVVTQPLTYAQNPATTSGAASRLVRAASSAGISLQTDKMKVSVDGDASVASAPMTTEPSLTFDDLVQGAPIELICLDSPDLFLLPSGANIAEGCYTVKAFLIPEIAPGEETPSLKARMQFINSETGEIAADLESLQNVTEDDPENQQEFNIDFSLRSRIATIFDAPGGGRVVSAKQVESCATTCVRKACGTCSTQHKVEWDTVNQVCRADTDTGRNCVVSEYSNCWEKGCNIARTLLEWSLATTGLGGVGGMGGRVVRYLWGFIP